MRWPPWRLVLHLALVLLVCGVGLASFSEAARRVGLHVDEIQYVWRSRYFWYLFVERDIGRSEWGDRLETHTHPMLANYLVGASLWAHGRSPDGLPIRYRPSIGPEANRLEGRVPDGAMLLEARQPMVFLAAGTLLLTYLVSALLAGPLAGLAAAALALSSPILRVYLVRAASDSPFAFFLMLALLVGLLGSRRGRRGALSLPWAVALGLALGLALASKLTAALSLAVVLGWGVVASLSAARGDSPGRGLHLGSGWVAARGWGLAIMVAVAVFVTSNPHLYPNPVLHIGHLLEYRADRMEVQQQVDLIAIRDPIQKLVFVVRGSLIGGVGPALRRRPLETGLQLGGEALLALFGLIALLLICYQGWRRKSEPRPEGLVLLTTAAYFVGLAGLIHVAWERYLVPTAIMVAVLSGVGLGTLLDQVRSLLDRGRRHRAPADRRIRRPFSREREPEAQGTPAD